MAMRTAGRTALVFRSDVPPRRRGAPRAGVVHAQADPPRPSGRDAGPPSPRRDVFAWLEDGADDFCTKRVANLLVKAGFARSGMAFVPFSSREEWERRYPLASIDMECDKSGSVKVSSRYDDEIFPVRKDAKGNPPKKQKGCVQGEAAKLIPTAALSDAERAQLHVSIYRYFSWLSDRTAELEATLNSRARVRKSGLFVPGLKNLVTMMEETFRAVPEFKASEEKREQAEGFGARKSGDQSESEGSNDGVDMKSDAGDSDDCGSSDGREHKKQKLMNPSMSELPFLEECLKMDMTFMVEELKSEKGDGTTKGYENHDFEYLFKHLVAYKKAQGHFNIAHHKHLEGTLPLGRWVADIRIRKRELAKRGMEHEAPVKDGENPDLIAIPLSKGALGVSVKFCKSADSAVITEILPTCTFRDRIEVGDRLVTVDGKIVSSEKDLPKGTATKVLGIAKKRSCHPNDYLSWERVERLKSIGFTWTNSFPCKSWDERFEMLKKFRETHQRWPGPKDSWQGVGQWLVRQRQKYAREDEDFMANHAHKLEEIGCPWSMRERSALSWADCIQKLREFHRVNRHFDVPPPKVGPEDTIEDDPEVLEEHCFYRWLSQLNACYKSYKKGQASGTGRLNKCRVDQLLDMGYPFPEVQEEEPTKKKLSPRQYVPKIGFDARVRQLKLFRQEFGHCNIDYRSAHYDNLGGWAQDISEQYRDWMNGTLAITPLMENRFEELRDNGFSFNALSDGTSRSWGDNFDALVEFQKVHGHCRVPSNYKADVRLGKWAAKQRLDYKLRSEGETNHSLTLERLEKLEALNFSWKK